MRQTKETTALLSSLLCDFYVDVFIVVPHHNVNTLHKIRGGFSSRGAVVSVRPQVKFGMFEHKNVSIK